MSKYITEISIVWCDGDVEEVAKQMKVKLTKKEVSDVLSLMDRKHDATIGITWDTIEYYINHIKGK